MLVSTILNYVSFTALYAVRVFLSPNAGIISWCGLHKLPSLKRVFCGIAKTRNQLDFAKSTFFFKKSAYK